MAAFVLAVIVDGHRRGQEACIQTGLMDICLRHLQISRTPMQTHTQMHLHDSTHTTGTEPLLLQWLCLCLGKLWEDFPEAQLLGLQSDAPGIVVPLLTESQPEVPCFLFATGKLFVYMFNMGLNSTMFCVWIAISVSCCEKCCC